MIPKFKSGKYKINDNEIVNYVNFFTKFLCFQLGFNSSHGRSLSETDANEPTHPPQAQGGGGIKVEAEDAPIGNNNGGQNKNDLQIPPSYDVGPQQIRESQIHKAMGSAGGGSLLTLAQIASENIKAEGKTAADELQDLDKNDMNGAMSVSSKRENTRPADDPSNPATEKKEAAAMEQTLLMAKTVKGKHLLLASEGHDIVSGSQEDKEKQRKKAREMANDKRAKEELNKKNENEKDYGIGIDNVPSEST